MFLLFRLDEAARRLEGTGPYRGVAGSVYLLRAGVLRATGSSLGSYTHWRIVGPSTLLFSEGGAADPGTSSSAACSAGFCVEVTLWPLQDIRLLRGYCARINYPFIPPAHLHCPPWSNTIARLLDSIRLSFQPPVCMLYTIYYW